MFTDTHCHINIMVDKKREALLESSQTTEIIKVIQAAHAAGVTRMLNVGTSLNETKNAITVAGLDQSVHATAGIHPCDGTASWRDEFAGITELVHEKAKHKIVAIGETGLDYFHTPYDKKLQRELFIAHIELALEHKLPLVVHVRNSADDAVAILSDYYKEIKGVYHCFLQDEKTARTVAEWGWNIGIDGPITYPKNDWLRDIVASFPLEQILLETDAPFLPVQAMRGKRNSPEYIPVIAQEIARVKEITIEKVGEQTTKNASALFGI